MGGPLRPPSGAATASHISLIPQPATEQQGAFYDRRMTPRVICWQRLDEPGMEWCQVTGGSAFGGRQISGVALVALEATPWRVDYEIELDGAGLTRRVAVTASNGEVSGGRSLVLEANGRGEWRDNGEVILEADNCLDVDLGFSPVTNSLPMWRLGMRVGEQRNIRVAWVLFPSLEVVLGEQSYERAEERLWRYRSKGFAADLDVGDDGLVEDYRGYWRQIRREAGSPDKK